MQFLAKLKYWAKQLKSKLVVAHLASKHPETPWYAKLLLLFTLAYALSPIDLIPDIIPILGILDDLFIVPVGIWLAFKMIPSKIIEDCNNRAATFQWNRKKNWIIAGLIIIIWVIIFTFLYLRLADKFLVFTQS